MDKKKIPMVSLFCGAGGLDMGFENQGFQTVWANDFDKDACETHREWSNAEVIQGDIGKVDFSAIPRTELIAGGFPCQGFSLAGPRKLDDSRNILYRYFVKLVEEKQPKVFVAENVKGLLTLGNGAIIEAILSDFASKGYIVKPTLVNAADYGVPQDRQRVIIVGIQKDLNKTFVFPKPLEKKVSLADALKDISKPEKDEICTAPYSSRYMSRNRKRNWNEQSFTIPAMAKQVTLYPGSPDMIKLGTDLWKFGDGGETRRLSYREAAAIQTFPKNMKFHGDLTSKYKQIGNAVPVKLAETVASEIYKIIGA
ncbi:MAG: DNA cytosine methyltransferase [Treponema sp.]|nr:DNA cytosine methyltransferase [Treponema sp.]